MAGAQGAGRSAEERLEGHELGDEGVEFVRERRPTRAKLADDLAPAILADRRFVQGSVPIVPAKST